MAPFTVPESRQTLDIKDTNWEGKLRVGKTQEGHGEKNVFLLLLYITGRHLVRDVLKPINTFGKSENEKVGGNVILNDIFKLLRTQNPTGWKQGLALMGYSWVTWMPMFVCWTWMEPGTCQKQRGNGRACSWGLCFSLGGITTPGRATVQV